MKVKECFSKAIYEFIRMRRKEYISEITTKELLIMYEGIVNLKYALVSNLFEITTDDNCLDVKFGKTIIEVMKVISERNNFEYIKNEDDYIKYILVVNILDKYNWLDWGTSIRGAWFYGGNKPEFPGSDLYDVDNYLSFNDKEIKEFLEYIESEEL